MKAVSITTTALLLIQNVYVSCHGDGENYVEETYLNNLDVDLSKPTYDQIIYKYLHNQEVSYDLRKESFDLKDLARDKRQVFTIFLLFNIKCDSIHKLFGNLNFVFCSNI